MTTTTGTLSPERVKSWLRRESQLREAYEYQAEVASRFPPEEPTDVSNGYEYTRERNAVFCALLEAHLDATKREPPAGLVEVIAGATCSAGVRVDQYAATLAPAIARAVETFATSDAAAEAALRVWVKTKWRGGDGMRDTIRAALGATEEGK